MTISTPDASSRVARNATAIAVSSMLARGLQFAWAIFLAQLLGQAGYGTWGTISGMITVAATLPEFGFGLIVLRDVARHRDLAGRYLAVTLVIQPILGAIAYILLIGAGLLLPYDTPIRLLLVIAGLNVMIDTLGNMGYNQLLAAEQMIATSAILVTHILLLVSFGFAILLSGGGLAGLYVATASAGVFRVAMHWIAMRRIDVRPRWPFDGSVARHLAIAGLPLAISSFFTLAYQHIDKVLVYTLLSSRDAGNLVSAFVIVFGVVEVLNTTILTALFPMMSRMAHESPEGLRHLTERLSFLTLVITLPVGVGVSALATPLARLLFPGFLGSSQVLEVLIWHTVVMMVGNGYAQQMLVQNRQTRLLIIRVVGLIFNIVLNILLLPVLGVQGAGVAIFVSQVVMLILLIAAQRPTAGNLAHWLGQAARVLVAGALMFGTIAVLRDFSPIIAGVVSLPAYALAVILMRALSREDWAIVRRVVVSLPVLGPRVAARIKS